MKAGLTLIGPREREQHFYLKPEHRCYYWGEYTPWNYTKGRANDFSETNRLISDSKLPMEVREVTTEWERKSKAILRISEAFAGFWRWRDLANKSILVPMPTSKCLDDPLYDDRMERVVSGIAALANTPLNAAPLIALDGSLKPSHSSDQRPKPQDIVRSIRIDRSAMPFETPEMVFLFDDVLTTGAHFVACATQIHQLYPNARVIGNFIARTRRPEPDE